MGKWVWTGVATTALLGASVCFLLAGNGERTAALLVWSWKTDALALSFFVGILSLAGGSLVALGSWVTGRTLLRSIARAAIRGSGGTLVLLALLAALQSGQATVVRGLLLQTPTGHLPLAVLLVACGSAAVISALGSLRKEGAS